MRLIDPGVANQAEARSSPWHAIYTRHQHEKAVARMLANKGFQVFLPLYRGSHQWRDRVIQLSLPLFPSYVFLRGAPEHRLKILTTPGIIFLVCFGSQPAVIPQEEIEAIRAVVQRGMHVEPHPFLKCGEWVRVKSGPLEGLEGILVRRKNQLRLVLTVELLQKSVGVEVDACVVERVFRGNGCAASRWALTHVTPAI